MFISGIDNVPEGVRKRHSMGCIAHERSLSESPLKKSGKLGSTLRHCKTADLAELEYFNHNNNITESFDLDDSVFVSEGWKSKAKLDEVREKAKQEASKGDQEVVVSERRTSVFLLLLVVIVSAGLGAWLYLQVDSCAVFDVDVVHLKHRLEDNVYGQHVAVRAVVDALTEFVSNVKSGGDKRSLGLSFHGWTGVGKNYISRFIAEAFYNARVSLYLIPLHFAHVDRSDGSVQGWITGNVTKCGVNVLIFDEIDKASQVALAEIQGAIQSEVRRQAEAEDQGATPIMVYIFISNTKSNQINQYLFSQLVNDRERELIRLDEFDKIFDKSENEWYHSMKSKGLIDVFVPFFPLAESHVKQCIIKEFVRRGRDPDQEMVAAVMNELSFFDMGGHNGQMSLTGCKRVPDKVDLHMDD